MTDHISKEQFLYEFFGTGRDLGNPKQFFTDNPADLIKFVEENDQNGLPSYISVQPRSAHHVVSGIEKIFYDFDYGRKNEKLTEKQIEKRRKEMEREVKIFIYQLKKKRIEPLIVKTNKGFHVYIYFNVVYGIDNDVKFWRQVYSKLYTRFLHDNNHRYKYVDLTSKDDIFRLSRVPLSLHHKTHQPCLILDANLKPTKIRSINYYRRYGLKKEDLIQAIKEVKCDLAEKQKRMKEIHQQRKENWEIVHGFVGEIRPCFKSALKSGEMSHQHRLALLIEGWWSGYKTEDKLVDLFRPLNDFNEEITRGQVKWFLKNKIKNGVCETKPYRCDTIIKYNWCLGDECPIYRKRKKYGKEKKTRRKN